MHTTLTGTILAQHHHSCVHVSICELEQSLMTRKSMGRHNMGRDINLMVDAEVTAMEDIYSKGVR